MKDLIMAIDSHALALSVALVSFLGLLMNFVTFKPENND